jgi:hypothetical protein
MLCSCEIRETALGRPECPLLALSGHAEHTAECPLSGVKRTWVGALQMSAFDPKRTLAVHCGSGSDAG